ncbi:DEAD/DEAH box helicase [Azotobacter vinelandii]|uniref:DEAD/DEAH box helicase n=1 Tax=Azotobacter vinelandii TaxID=354 RepID=UPI00090F7E8A|nr:DEAD/DEAH box helicase [Azotobacter vinelandii]WKN23197.1 DEAD/DEAH box helicase [Azotobacter vinelandii]SFY08968.1 Helicase conserved C-terminal domain-containing protein [Azotobacter vinelandii]
MTRPRLVNGPPEMLRKAVFDGYDFGLQLPYIDGANKLFLERDGFFIRKSDHPLQRYWRVPKGKLLADLDLLFHRLTELAQGRLIESWQGFQQKLEQAQAHLIREAFTWGMVLRIAPLADGGILLSGDYHPGVVAVARRMHGVFLGPSRAWRINSSVELVRSNIILELGLAEEQFEILDTVHELLGDGSVAPSEAMPRISLGGPPQEVSGQNANEEVSSEIYLAAVPTIERTEYTEADIAKALEGYSLLDHQPAGIAHLLQRTSALLADDMGLGKTRQSIIAAHIRAAGRPILVITLSSLLINWEREIHAVYTDARVALQHDDLDADWMVINYERLGDYVLPAERFHVMIVDEAHRLKEPTAEWTRHGFDIAAQVPNRYLLTGTPLLNRETELHTLLRLSGHPVGQLPLKDFCERFTGSPEFRQNLRAELGDWMLRRRKDVLPNLKGKQRQLLPIALTAKERRKYDTLRLEDRPIFARLGALRRYLEQVKVRVAMDLIAELDLQDKVILFCEFKPTVAMLKELCDQAGIGNVTLVGTDTLKKRQKAIDTFQGDADCRAFICTTSAAGTGNNLTAANYVIFLGLPWTPGQQDQAEDRAYRNGQLRMVIVKIPLVDDTIDQQLWQMLLAKRQVSLELIEPEEDQEIIAKTLLAAVVAGESC